MHQGVAIAAAALLAGMLVGCGKSPADSAAGAAASAALGTRVAVDDDGDTVTLGEGDDATTFSGGDSARLPDGFPDDIYLPDDYTVDSAIGSGDFTVVSLSAPGELDAMADKAQAHMRSAGWTQQMMAGDDSNRMYAFRNEQTVASLSFDAEDDGVIYTVQLSRAPN